MAGGAESSALPADLVVEVVDSLPSTHRAATERAMAGAPDGLVVVADHQTAGRGRLDRGWQTPPGTAVTFSLLLRPARPAPTWPWLPLLTGYAVARVLRRRDLDAGVKWPNDVLVAATPHSPTGGRKVAGILVERLQTPHGPAAAVGVGLNVGFREKELPIPTATSMEIELGHPVDRTDVLVEVLTAIRETLDAWEAADAAGDAKLAASYQAACVTVGRDVRVHLPDGSTLEGRAVGVDRDGRLVLEHGRGRTPVAAGDVVHVRPLEEP